MPGVPVTSPEAGEPLSRVHSRAFAETVFAVCVSLSDGAAGIMQVKTTALKTFARLPFPINAVNRM